MIHVYHFKLLLNHLFRQTQATAMANGSLLSNTSNVTISAIPEGAITIYNIYLSLIIALGVPGNLLVLLVYWKNRVVNSTDCFIIFITFYDLISASINVPVYLTFTTGTWKLYGSDIICKVHMFLSQSVVLSSTFLICGIAVERYWKVCQPSRTKLTQKKSRNICFVICLIAFVISIPTFVFFYNKNDHCMVANKGMPTTPLVLYYSALLLIFVIAIGILLFSYSKIAKAIIQSELNLRKHVHIHVEEDNISQSAFKECLCSAFCCNTNKIYPELQSTEDSNSQSDTKPSVRSEVIKRYGDEGKIISKEQIRLSDAANKQSNILNAQQGTGLTLYRPEIVRRSELDPVMEQETIFEASGSSVSTEVYFPTKASTSTSDRHRHVDGDNCRKCMYTAQSTDGHTCTRTNCYRKTHHNITGVRQYQVDYNISRIFTSQTPADGQVERNIFRQTSSQSKQSTASVDISSLRERTRVRKCLRATTIVFLICLIFVLSWLPPWISFINFVLLPPETKLTPTYLTMTMFCRMAYLVNSFTNPILYTILNRKFRERLRNVCS